jgi:hypothetical protein
MVQSSHRKIIHNVQGWMTDDEEWQMGRMDGWWFGWLMNGWLFD